METKNLLSETISAGQDPKTLSRAFHNALRRLVPNLILGPFLLSEETGPLVTVTSEDGQTVTTGYLMVLEHQERVGPSGIRAMIESMNTVSDLLSQEPLVFTIPLTGEETWEMRMTATLMEKAATNPLDEVRPQEQTISSTGTVTTDEYQKVDEPVQSVLREEEAQKQASGREAQPDEVFHLSIPKEELGIEVKEGESPYQAATFTLRDNGDSITLKVDVPEEGQAEEEKVEEEEPFLSYRRKHKLPLPLIHTPGSYDDLKTRLENLLFDFHEMLPGIGARTDLNEVPYLRDVLEAISKGTPSAAAQAVELLNRPTFLLYNDLLTAGNFLHKTALASQCLEGHAHHNPYLSKGYTRLQTATGHLSALLLSEEEAELKKQA